MVSMRKKYGLLTHTQLLALYYKSKGYSFRSIAKIFGTSHQNIAVAYHRASRNVELARDTIIYSELVTAKLIIFISKGTHLIDIPRMIINECDKYNIKVRADFTLIFKLIRFHKPSVVKDTYLSKDILVIIDRHGSIKIYDYEEIAGYIKELERLVKGDIINVRYRGEKT
jgi:Tfx family DNA-binding protein